MSHITHTQWSHNRHGQMAQSYLTANAKFDAVIHGVFQQCDGVLVWDKVSRIRAQECGGSLDGDVKRCWVLVMYIYIELPLQ